MKFNFLKSEDPYHAYYKYKVRWRPVRSATPSVLQPARSLLHLCCGAVTCIIARGDSRSLAAPLLRHREGLALWGRRWQTMQSPPPELTPQLHVPPQTSAKADAASCQRRQ